ncbi:MAG: hypothetical protein A2754_00680 [Candidatus Magasanikbacteria bacterium RIFCSPHIGHO2_01_FULL_47_8]|uniref:Glycosyltransferase 2-like domain-containing protein n=1 Tax=Candidatus Magasanikbacteria bacterium RIFCSPHIGHO2_01_FULL_47_8 TaxID=1798673 RepID=A0A1F6MEN9_9BACT|nr:MAG: hypothetical protein A2754_00680 [Candidatus Magasanikbacteria bacterium RIFCSPHIGHO2_01_FULL_47_8]
MEPLASIVIPMFRDRATIGATLDALALFLGTTGWSAEVIIVNDGGTDGGVEIVKEKMKQRAFLKLIDRAVNRGKGFTVREGIAAARGNFIFFTDADLPYGTEPILKMLELLRNGAADVVLANRNIAETAKKPSWARQITHVIYSYFVRSLIPITFSDTLAGLKALTKSAAQRIIPKLTIDRFSFDVELLLAAKRAGFRIQEVPVSLKNVGTSNLRIRRDAPEMIREIVQIFLKDKKGQYR